MSPAEHRDYFVFWGVAALVAIGAGALGLRWHAKYLVRHLGDRR